MAASAYLSPPLPIAGAAMALQVDNVTPAARSRLDSVSAPVKVSDRVCSCGRLEFICVTHFARPVSQL